jgi:hypothetical protein
MPGHERHLLAGEFLADRARLLRIAGIVADFELELLAEHAALGVDVGDGGFGAVLQLRAERRVLARHRPRDADGDLLCGGRSAECEPGERKTCREQNSIKTQLIHGVLPLMTMLMPRDRRAARVKPDAGRILSGISASHQRPAPDSCRFSRVLVTLAPG